MMNCFNVHKLANRKIKMSVAYLEPVEIMSGDIIEFFADLDNDVIYLIPEKEKSSLLKSYGSAMLNDDLSIEFPEKLIEDMSLNDNEEMTMNVDIIRNCIYATPTPPKCVFCGELGEKKLSGKHICAGCIDKISLGEF